MAQARGRHRQARCMPRSILLNRHSPPSASPYPRSQPPRTAMCLRSKHPPGAAPPSAQTGQTRSRAVGAIDTLARRAGLCPRWGPGHWQKCRAALARKLDVGGKTCPQNCVTFDQSNRLNNNVRQLAHVSAFSIRSLFLSRTGKASACNPSRMRR